LLRSKNLATKFQILAEIAASQPNIRQKEIAQKLAVTPQAISEYIKELLKEGLLTSEGRSRYRVTREGVDWILRMTRELQSYSASVGKVVADISVCAAVAECDLSPGQPVGLVMRNGLLFATGSAGEGAKGLTTSAAQRGEDVGVSDIEGVMEFKPGKVTICKVCGIQTGGSRAVDLARLRKEVEHRRMVGVIGLEALTALRQIDIEPNYLYGVKEAAVEAAYSGLSPLIVCVEDNTSGLIRRLEEGQLDYELLDLRVTP
jgi:putative transcriptional regulator